MFITHAKLEIESQEYTMIKEISHSFQLLQFPWVYLATNQYSFLCCIHLSSKIKHTDLNNLNASNIGKSMYSVSSQHWKKNRDMHNVIESYLVKRCKTHNAANYVGTFCSNEWLLFSRSSQVTFWAVYLEPPKRS